MVPQVVSPRMEMKSREVGHRDLWEAIFCFRRDAGAVLKFVWTPSHMSVGGNDQADKLAEAGKEMHPNNKKRRDEPENMPQWWQDAGLSPMRTDVSSSEASGDSEAPGELSSRSSGGRGDLTSVTVSSVSTSSSGSSSEAVGSSGEDSRFSTPVSDRQRERRLHLRGR